MAVFVDAGKPKDVLTHTRCVGCDEYWVSRIGKPLFMHAEAGELFVKSGDAVFYVMRVDPTDFRAVGGGGKADGGHACEYLCRMGAVDRILSLRSCDLIVV